MTKSLSTTLNDYAIDRRDQKTDQFVLLEAFKNFLEGDFGCEYDLTATVKKENNTTYSVDVKFHNEKDNALRFKFAQACFSIEVILTTSGYGQEYNKDVVYALQSAFLSTELLDNKCKVVYEYRNAAQGTNFPDNVLERFGKFLIDCMNQKGILSEIKPRPKPRPFGHELG